MTEMPRTAIYRGKLFSLEWIAEGFNLFLYENQDKEYILVNELKKTVINFKKYEKPEDDKT